VSEASGILSTVEQDGVSIVRFNSSQILDLDLADELEVEFKRLLDGKAGRSWVIDFAGVDAIISRVVSVLLVVLRLVRAGGGMICLCNMGETVDRVVKLAKLDRVFNIYSTLEQAMAFVKR
jgi:anti-anti-sigma factor